MRPLDGLLLAGAMWLLLVWCHWRIITKAGLNPLLVLFFVIPYLAPVGWLLLAVMEWPSPPTGNPKVKVYGRR